MLIDLFSRRAESGRPGECNLLRPDRSDRRLRTVIVTSYARVLRRPIELAQYCSIDYQAVLRKHGLLISMSGKGNCYDNAVVETFFKTIKSELIWPVSWQIRSQAENAVARYIGRVRQSDPPPFDARLPEPGPLRDGGPRVSNQLSTKPKQDQSVLCSSFSGDQPEPGRIGVGQDLDPLDHEAGAVPQNRRLAGAGGAADNVDQQPVAVGDEGLHEVAPCLCAGHKASSTIKPRCHS